MIVNFSIQNFGSIKDKQTLSFEADKSTHLEDYYVIQPIIGLRLLKLGIIYGANASGKTTILKAFELLRNIVLNPKKKKTDSLNFNPYLFDILTTDQNSILSIDFIQNEVRYYYEVEFNKRAIIKEELNFYKPNKANIFKRTTNLDNQFSEITLGSKIKKDKIFEKSLISNTLWNNTVLGGYLKTNIEFKELKEATDWFSNYTNELILTTTKLEDYITSQINEGELKKADLINILKKADFNISDIVIQEVEKSIPDGFIKFLDTQNDISNDKINELRGMGKFTSVNMDFEHTVNDQKYILPFDLESEGTQKFYGLAGILTILIKHSSMFSIDELESSLHPDLFVHFLLSFLINSKTSQIIATTHNREILNNKDIFRNDVIWFTNKRETSATELYSLSDFESSVIRDTSNVYNAYKIGKLGAVPNLGDYYIDIDNEKK